MTDTSLADYVLAEITRCCGPQLPCPGQDLILAGFADRWGDQAMDICRQVFGTHNGFWMSAPVTVRRFHHSQDDFFAIPLRAELGASGNNTR